ncbi:MAG: hypothetical protein AVDCRST_MAG75-2447, partial [uncultured Propionibacteriaceae bacterium]
CRSRCGESSRSSSWRPSCPLRVLQQSGTTPRTSPPLREPPKRRSLQRNRGLWPGV